MYRYDTIPRVSQKDPCHATPSVACAVRSLLRFRSDSFGWAKIKTPTPVGVMIFIGFSLLGKKAGIWSFKLIHRYSSAWGGGCGTGSRGWFECPALLLGDVVVGFLEPILQVHCSLSPSDRDTRSQIHSDSPWSLCYFD